MTTTTTTTTTHQGCFTINTAHSQGSVGPSLCGPTTWLLSELMVMSKSAAAAAPQKKWKCSEKELNRKRLHRLENHANIKRGDRTYREKNKENCERRTETWKANGRKENSIYWDKMVDVILVGCVATSCNEIIDKLKMDIFRNERADLFELEVICHALRVDVMRGKEEVVSELAAEDLFDQFCLELLADRTPDWFDWRFEKLAKKLAPKQNKRHITENAILGKRRMCKQRVLQWKQALQLTTPEALKRIPKSNPRKFEDFVVFVRNHCRTQMPDVSNRSILQAMERVMLLKFQSDRLCITKRGQLELLRVTMNLPEWSK